MPRIAPLAEAVSRGTMVQAEPIDEATRYLQCIPLEERRLAGQVYTPAHLVAFVLDRAEYTSDGEIETRALLDPACGAGVFLTAAVVRLGGRFTVLGVDIERGQGRRRFLSTVSDRLFGVDIDREACLLARRAVRDAVLALSPGKLADDFFIENIITADFLTDAAVDGLGPVAAGGFDLVVGNPPYVSATRLDIAYKIVLKARFATATGRLDLYTLFMERALPLLVDHGRLAFITPNKFLASETSKPLRSLLLKTGAVRSVATFRSHKVFADAATVPCVLVFERGSRAEKIELLECGDRPTAAGEVEIHARAAMKRSALTSGPWQVMAPTLLAIAERLQGNHRTLGTYTSRISAGFATGRDDLFVIAGDARTEVEPELLRPAVRGRDLQPYAIANSELSILVPYRYDRPGRPELVDLAEYPRALRHLEAHRAVLEDRHCVRVWDKRWYDLHDPVPFDLAALPKILVPDIACGNRFAFDAGQYCPLHSAYYLLPNRIEPEFLTALLNSEPIEFLIRLLAPVVKDGFSRYRKQFLIHLPIPAATPAQRRGLVEAAADCDEDRVNELASALFKVTDADRAEMSTFLRRAATPPRVRRKLLASGAA